MSATTRMVDAPDAPQYRASWLPLPTSRSASTQLTAAATQKLRALTATDAAPALRAMEYWICRLARRAMRLLKMEGIDLARRLGLLSALPMLPWFMPNRELSQALHAFTDSVLERLPRQRPPPGLLTLLGKCLHHAGGRAVWSKRLAPP